MATWGGDSSSNGSDTRLLRSALGGILSDESFNIPTEEAKMCLDTAQKLVALYGDPPPASVCTDFSSWLVTELKDIITKSTKRSGSINHEKLWGLYQENTSSVAFKQKWEGILTYAKLPVEPLFYQHMTDVMFESLVKEAVAPTEADVRECEYNEGLTFEEENAVRYVGGFVVHSLLKEKGSDLGDVLKELVDVNPEGVTEGMGQEWISAVDRGGLTRITTDAYQFFYAVELCTRRYLRVSKVAEMNDHFRKHLTDCIENDGDVLFYWCIAGQDESDEISCKCFQRLIEKWVTIRGFSFAANLMEMYKQEVKKGTGKAKSLRSKLCT